MGQGLDPGFQEEPHLTPLRAPVYPPSCLCVRVQEHEHFGQALAVLGEGRLGKGRELSFSIKKT